MNPNLKTTGLITVFLLLMVMSGILAHKIAKEPGVEKTDFGMFIIVCGMAIFVARGGEFEVFGILKIKEELAGIKSELGNIASAHANAKASASANGPVIIVPNSASAAVVKEENVIKITL